MAETVSNKEKEKWMKFFDKNKDAFDKMNPFGNNYNHKKILNELVDVQPFPPGAVEAYHKNEYDKLNKKKKLLSKPYKHQGNKELHHPNGQLLDKAKKLSDTIAKEILAEEDQKIFTNLKAASEYNTEMEKKKQQKQIFEAVNVGFMTPEEGSAMISDIEKEYNKKTPNKTVVIDSMNEYYTKCINEYYLGKKHFDKEHIDKFKKYLEKQHDIYKKGGTRKCLPALILAVCLLLEKIGKTAESNNLKTLLDNDLNIVSSVVDIEVVNAISECIEKCVSVDKKEDENDIKTDKTYRFLDF